MLQLHTVAPDFSLVDQNGVIHTLKECLGKKVLLYFYPKDDTPGAQQRHVILEITMKLCLRVVL
jgi:peroxiredoxin Q/BCP